MASSSLEAENYDKYGHSLFVDEPSPGKLVLDFPHYVNTISSLILQSFPNFTIGIFGNWGTGKTTLMKNIEWKLSRKEECNCLFFNAWKYEQEPTHIAFPLILSVLLQIYKVNNKAIDDWDKKSNQNFRKRFQQVVSGLSLKMTFGVPGIANLDVGYDFSKPLDRKTWDFLNFRSRLQQYNVEQTKLYEGIDLITKLVESDFIKGYGNNGLKLVVFIDDLDRCTPEKAAEMFEITKAFLNIKGIIFVLGLSNKIIEMVVQEKYKYLGNEFSGEDYLKKIFQLPIHIPLWQSRDIDEYIKALLAEHEKSAIPSQPIQAFKDNVKLIIQGLEPNPREVKRFLNIFILSYEIQQLTQQFRKTSQHFLAAQILRFRWDWFYDAILADETFLEKVQASLFEQTKGEIESKLLNKILGEKPLVDFLKGDGIIIFEIGFEEWSRIKKSDVSDVKDTSANKSVELENVSELTTQEFVTLSNEKQEAAWEMIKKNDALAERLGFSLGRSDFSHLDTRIQDRIWEETKRNRSFSVGLGSSLGREYISLSSEVKELVWSKTRLSESISFAFGRSLAESFDRLDPKLDGDKFLKRLEADDSFAEGAVTTFAQYFPRLNQKLRNMVWVLASQKERIAQVLGMHLGDSNFGKISRDLQEEILNKVGAISSFATALAISLGKNFSLFSTKVQEMIWEKTNAGWQSTSSGFTRAFGRSLGENYTYLNKRVKDRFKQEVKDNSELAAGLAEAPPFVYETIPVNDAAFVSINTEVIASFNKIVNENTINPQTFKLRDEPSDSIVVASVKLEGVKATLKPSFALKYSSMYIATISDVKDMEDGSMAEDVTWSFTTESAQ